MNRILIFCLMSMFCLEAFSQGCSDAGFCTMGAMRPDQHYDKKIRLKLRSIEYNFYRGKTNLTPVVTAHTIEANFSINDNNFVHVKLPYQRIEGNFGTSSGLGDISLSVTRKITNFLDGEINATAGMKIPTGNGALEDSLGRDWPMYHQPSLGTYDIILGASFINRKWLVATGIQIPLNRNENQFRYDEWISNENPDWNYPGGVEYVLRYDIATYLRRGTDVMLRVERNFRFVNWNVSLGLLPIYRINRDEIFNISTGEREKLDNTRGLAASALLGIGYQINVSHGLKFIYGQKLTDRPVNPDGLTRENVLSISYIYRF